MLHLYYGPGKGKSTAALGMLLRAYGHGLKVAYFGFLKGEGFYGEFETLKKLDIEKYCLGKSCPYASLIKTGIKSCPVKDNCNLCHVNLKNPDEEDKKLFLEGFFWAKAQINASPYRLVVMDELALAAKIDLIDEESLTSFLKEIKRKENLEMILTGREAPLYLKAYADYVTYFAEEKHPFTELGLTSRKGVEF
ncbi:cob(I)yrinic acid a,c-diamide adenosyltransferase [Carboxydothermus hydrogenoformans]|uniref:Putative cob(I)alamin adenosyltransferase n=1 Tax=Carboxydothermus hydrogenoformans (strain ATCC BAA-161 / DSM 6008 / Z-2901) TaxID=246194 RepID=Q3AEK5_CARHZ|nr:cob(I)yrinic acid a,c-diamide adenosyltransferase [Carboxydothermus hydrogenoformans]ABB15465.1 putative cob(I)alamin adenosyltransferase [Carboxydothermus hydrogenoformans Z-2901]